MTDRIQLPDVGRDVWSAFQAGTTPPIDAQLLACWTRARSLGAPIDGAAPEDHLLRGAALQLHAEQLELVHAIGDAVLDRAAARVTDHDYVLLLADAEGVVVDARGGGDFHAAARGLRLIEGASWSEHARGTNAIGTAASLNRPVEVHGHAHFGQRYRDLVCYAAPVRGIDGTPLAVLDATSWLPRAHAGVGDVVVRAAAALEELIRLQAFAAAGQSVVRLLGRSLDRMRDPALLVEAPGRVARSNPAARSVLPASDPLGALGVTWFELAAEALAPAAGGRAIEVGPARRAWRMRVEPVAAPGGNVLAVMIVLEPGRRVAALPVRAADPFDPIFAEDAAVTSAIAWSRRLAASELPVMLLAETGAGKELFAHAIHAASPRATGPWLAINCGAVAPALLETELFGYAPGAFTGAERAGRTGLFRAAHGGTLFLDEVAEMPPAMQAALLRVIETGAYRRVGDTRLERSDVRIICATCRDLAALVAAGTFRQDLYYRLQGATVRIPALRERTDLLALARHVLGDVELSPEAAAAIAQHRWPGNVRELKSLLAVAALRADGSGWIEAAHLAPELAATAPPEGCLDDAERAAVQRAVAEAAGNLSAAARRLGVARSTLYRMLRRHGLV